jgi:hypothetical protein
MQEEKPNTQFLSVALLLLRKENEMSPHLNTSCAMSAPSLVITENCTRPKNPAAAKLVSEHIRKRKLELLEARQRKSAQKKNAQAAQAQMAACCGDEEYEDDGIDASDVESVHVAFIRETSFDNLQHHWLPLLPSP